ncbi:cyclopropane fatty acyl phospholipid synthase [Alteromonas aestuariivivens]|uniref:Cyclopropane fatty acyl phospholipid synthase n=1 Tax=Alteromonas aestuariivivens TaxID=1938339 RepID=A0A3D8MA12_9ALTE|nr:cyclopropane fatty acyl phospholipid synthase [Alteromonas aestuariivivens]RDV26650.1 cyclopropane fatty acyl phospholipid synthase [Alteromonas aestuariivivens]
MADSVPHSQQNPVFSSLSVTRQQARIRDGLQSMLAPADIKLNGERPWDPQVQNPRFYDRLCRQGSLGAGESYMDGDWECQQLDEFVSRVLSVQFDQRLQNKWVYIRNRLLGKLCNLQSCTRAWQVGEQHYDVGNNLYQAMLDKTMAYSCGYWQKARDLYQAQVAKLDLICQKLYLRPGENVLDIGCGWGSFAQYAAEHYGVNVTGVTISREQQVLALQRCAGLPVNIELQDYRSLKGEFDKLVSIGMFEHVGPKNYPIYMQTACDLMAEDGIFVLHTIGSDATRKCTDPWIHKYIFPNGAIPSLREISAAAEPYFVIEDVHNFGPDYDRTLMAWHNNFSLAWPSLKSGYSERFFRMWSYYLKSCAGAFRCRNLQLFQVVLRKKLRPLPRYTCR